MRILFVHPDVVLLFRFNNIFETGISFIFSDGVADLLKTGCLLPLALRKKSMYRAFYSFLLTVN